jgi:hypothetical protein
MENADKNEPTEPIESAEPIEPIDSTEPLDPIDNTELSDHKDHRDPDSPDFTPHLLRHRLTECTTGRMRPPGPPGTGI